MNKLTKRLSEDKISKVKNDDYIGFGYPVIITHLGVWGHRANSYEYAVSGIKGKYPNYTYRLTRVGYSSIFEDRYYDVELKSDQLFVGYEDSLLVIDSAGNVGGKK